MSTYNESGHAKNVANFGLLVSTLEPLGISYIPSNSLLALSSLNTLKTSLNTQLESVRMAEMAYRSAVNERQLGFEGVSKLSTRVLNAFDSSTTNAKAVKDAKGLVKKINGSRIKAVKADENGDMPKTISVSQMSFDSRLQNFRDFVAFLENYSEYAPNEVELKLVTLRNYGNDLANYTNVLNQKSIALRNERILRDKMLYNEENGVIILTKLIKKYIKSVFGASSEEYKTISKIAFNDPR